jgi:hypothetical protein
MNHVKDQTGAALVVEIILVAVVLSMAGIAFYSSLKQEAPVITKATPMPTKAPTPAPTPNMYAGWQTHTVAYEKASYKYPSTWKFSQTSQPLAVGSSITVETDTLTSPTGLVLTLATPVQGVGGACGPSDCPEVTTSSADPVALANVKQPVYLVVDQGKSTAGVIDRRVGLEELATPPVLGTSSQLYQDLSLLASHGPDHLFMTFGGGYAHGAAENNLSFADYVQLPDVTTAELILKSLSFTTPE